MIDYSNEPINEKILKNSITHFDGLITEIQKYDVYDFIARVAGMSLTPQNQNKTVYFNSIISDVLSHSKDEFSSSIKMSPSKFKQLLKTVENSPLKSIIDPNENFYIQRVLYKGNKRIICGSDGEAAYILQIISKILFEKNNPYPLSFISKMRCLFDFCIGISEKAIEELSLSNDITIDDDNRDIFFPDSRTIDNNANAITIDICEYDGLFNDEFVEEAFSSFGMKRYEDVDNMPFFEKPFLLVENRIIILDITKLPSFIISYMLQQTCELGLMERVLGNYNNYVWNLCLNYLNRLGNSIISQQKVGLSLLNYQYYKESMHEIDIDKLLLFIFVCDDGYSIETNHYSYQDDRIPKLLDKRIPYFVKVLGGQNYKAKDIFVLIVMNKSGRYMKFKIKNLIELSTYKPLVVQPNELECISINERKRKMFISKYLQARERIKYQPIGYISEMNTIALYSENNYSFYFNDDMDMREVSLIVHPGMSLGYISNALKYNDCTQVRTHVAGEYRDVSFSGKRKVYFDQSIGENRLALVDLLDDKKLVFWFVINNVDSREKQEIAHTLLDTLSFWFVELENYFVGLKLTETVYSLFVNITGNTSDYYNYSEYGNTFDKTLTIEKDEIHKKYVVHFTAEAYQLLNCRDNTAEKKLIKFILTAMGFSENMCEETNQQFEEVFKDPLKKKCFTFNCIENPMLQPIRTIYSEATIYQEDESLILDEIGAEIINTGNWTYGIIKAEQQIECINNVVTILFSTLQKEVNELNSLSLFNRVYYNIEQSVFNIVSFRHYYPNEVRCYPEKQEEFIQEDNEQNKISVALKFLMEYIAAQPPKGEKVLTEEKYQRLLAICHQIIEWAYKSDLISNGIINTPVVVLKSKRVGLDNSGIAYVNEQAETIKDSELRYISSSVSNDSSAWLLELDEAFESERGYTYSQFIQIMYCFVTLGLEHGGEVIICNVHDVIDDICSLCYKPKAVVQSVIKDVVLKSRESYFEPPEGMERRDVFPWRFKRKYSIMLRPVIYNEGKLIWGTRQVFQSILYLNHLIHDGTYTTKDEKMKKIIGRITHQRGMEYNKRIVEIIKRMDYFKVFPNVKKIKKHRIADDQGNDLGDIDIILVDCERNDIYIIEVKDFSFAKNPHEIHLEYEKMFVDHMKKPCYLSKHERRVKWIKTHFEEVCSEYNLKPDESWQVKNAFIIKQPMISSRIFLKKANIISESELTKDKLLRIKAN